MSFLLTLFIKNYAIKKSFLSQVNERSSHTIPTPHGGGIAIAISWFVGLIYLYHNNQIEENLFKSLIPGMIIALISFFDDIYELSAKLRLFVQLFVSCLGVFLLGGLSIINFGFIEISNPLVTNLVAVIATIWFINLYNFLDGINGYAGTEAIVLSISGLILFGGDHFLVLMVSVFGFLYWNWNNAKIFMGDVGSTLLGYNVAIFTIYYGNISSEYLWIWLSLFGLFWFDATLTLIRRKLNGEKLSTPHKKHAYQRLTQAGWSHMKVVIYSIVVNALILAIVYFIDNIAITTIVSIIIFYLCMKIVDKKKKFQ